MSSRDFENCKEAHQAVLIMLRDASAALKKNDILRAQTLIVDWHLEYAVMRSIEEEEREQS